MIVNANLSSLSAQRMLFENSKAASTAMERLATGSKIMIGATLKRFCSYVFIGIF